MAVFGAVLMPVIVLQNFTLHHQHIPLRSFGTVTWKGRPIKTANIK